MLQIVDFGDVIILKKDDLIDKVRSVRPEKASDLESNLLNIDTLKYYFGKNHLGQMSITEHSIDRSGNVVDIRGHIDEKLLYPKVNVETVLHLLSLELATLVKSDQLFIPNNIDSKVRLSDKISVSDGDLFYVPLSEFSNFLNRCKSADKSYIETIEKIKEAGLETALISFNYEDERKDSLYRSKRTYRFDSKINPYTDMVADLFIGDKKMSFFIENVSHKSSLEEIKKSVSADKENYRLMIEDFKNNKDKSFSKSQGFIDRVKFYDGCSEIFQRYYANIINLFSNDEMFTSKLKFVGNYRDNERMFLNSPKLAEITENLFLKLQKEKSFKNSPSF